MIHSRVSWMLAPVDRSIIVSAPQMVLHCSFSTSCSAHARPLIEFHLFLTRGTLLRRSALQATEAPGVWSNVLGLRSRRLLWQ